MKNYLFITAIVLLASCEQKKPVEASVNSQIVDNFPEKLKASTIYEVNIRQHTPEGTINAFIKDLPRLKELGIGMLWIMPVQPIGIKNRKEPLGSYYSIRDYKKVNEKFGTDTDFKNLVIRSALTIILINRLIKRDSPPNSQYDSADRSRRKRL